MGSTHWRTSRIQVAARPRHGPEDARAQSPIEFVGRDAAEELQSEAGGEDVSVDGGEDTGVGRYGFRLVLLGLQFHGE